MPTDAFGWVICNVTICNVLCCTARTLTRSDRAGTGIAFIISMIMRRADSPEIAFRKLKLLFLFALLPAVFPAPLCADSGTALVLDSIVVTGNHRTTESVIHQVAGILPGSSATPDDILIAVERLRGADIFKKVEFSTRRGEERGHLILDLRVQEKGVEVGVGAGYRDLNGWYLIPAELRLDNRLGRAERTRLQLKLGYRLAGLRFYFEENRFGDGKNHWGFSASTFRHDRRYFEEGTEFGLALDRSEMEAHIGRWFGDRWGVAFGAGVEQITTDSVATARKANEPLGIQYNEERSFADLPADVAAGVGEDRRVMVRMDLLWDSRSGQLVTGTPAGGFWGRGRWEGVLGEDRSYAIGTIDLRSYSSAGPISLAGRIRGGVTSAQAPFFDRFYVGGLYAVRGFPEQSLSVAGGESRFWTVSFEMRGPLIGDRVDPRLAGLVFIDAGDGWNDEEAKLDDVALSAGYGLRLRLPWVGRAGLDIGFPISESPVEEAVHVTFSLGWTF